tara:strand:- start:1814 stop:2134 length:321 start_codon:yes stop_codon:yes gene_type:complete
MGRNVTVGTAAVLVFNENSNRTGVTIQMYPTGVASGNTGTVAVGKGFQPSTTVGAPNAGLILNAGATFIESKDSEGLPVFKGQIWVISDSASQQLFVEETSEEGGQ